MNIDWMKDDIVKDIPIEKLQFLEKLYSESAGKDQKSLIKTLIPLIKSANEKGLTFSQEELKNAITAIKNHSSDEEKEKIDKILNHKMK